MKINTCLAACSVSLLFSGCWTVSETEYPDVEVTRLPAGKTASVSLSGFEVDLQRYVPVEGHEQMKTNPEKVKAWFEKATVVKQMSDSLFNYAQSLKEQIVREADGKDADVTNIVGKDNIEAAAQVMLAPGTGQGGKLYNAINSYRERILQMVTDPHQKKLIADNLSTEVPKKDNALGKNWQEYMFESMPVAAAVTLLSKLQSDIRYAEGEVLHTLVANIDIKDIRVNRLNAFVIPEKTTLYPGETFTANIVMAAVDTTQQPEIYVNGTKVNTTNGKYSFTAGLLM